MLNADRDMQGIDSIGWSPHNKTNAARNSVAAYLGAAVLVVGATLLRRTVFPHVEDANIALLGTVMVVAWWAGRGPGICAAILGTLATTYYFVPPFRSLTISSLDHVMIVGLTLIEGLVICLLTGSLHRARERAVAGAGRLAEAHAALAVAKTGLEGEVARRTRQLSTALDTMHALFELSPTAMMVVDAESLTFLDVNQAATSLYGYRYGEFLSLRADSLWFEKDRPRFGEAVEAVSMEDGVVRARRHRAASGRALDVEVASRVVTYQGQRAFLIAIIDVTERRAQEARALEAQKMEALGRLAGGVAHDFNNLLAVIHSYIDFAIEDLSADQDRGELASDLGQVREAARRATNLTQQLLALSRRQVVNPTSIDVRAAVQRMEPMLRTLAGERIELELEPGGSVATLIDRTQLEQVVLNLVVNARDAIVEDGRITITVGARDVAADSPHAGDFPGPGSWLVLGVRDDGAGMDEETKARVFEPFFTTKDGKGTGLGLATVFGIVSQARGRVRVDSALGRGTLFEVVLPRTDAASPESSPSAPPPMRATGETVLLVEDDADVRRAALRALRRSGYHVIEATSPGEAVFLFERHRDDIDVLVTDVVMPHLTGPDLAARLKIARPSLPVLFMSGYADDEKQRVAIAASGAPFVQKPFLPNVLAAGVDAALRVRA